MKKFEYPEIDIRVFVIEDVITTSMWGGEEDELPRD